MTATNTREHEEANRRRVSHEDTKTRKSALAVGALAALGIVSHAGVAHAQTPGRIVASVGVRWTGEAAAGAMDATETAPTSSRYRLFETETALSPSAGLETSVGVRLTRAIEAELSASYATSDLRTRIRADAESIPDSEAAEAVGQLSLEASLVVHVPRWTLFGRATPFVSAGGGYLRHLHEGRTFAETGVIYHAGVGVTLTISSDGRGVFKATGLRADTRAVVRTGGVAFDDDPRVAPAVGLSLFARF